MGMIYTEKILSGLQEAYGINTYKERENVEEGTKAYAINQMASLIEKYDSAQNGSYFVGCYGNSTY